jgi:hypothetical protein
MLVEVSIMNRLLRLAFAFVAVASVTAVAPALARGTSSIQGVIVESKHNRPLPSAAVSAFSSHTNVLAGTARSDRNGGFKISGLSAGEYRLFVTKPGYRSVEVSALTVEANDRMIIGFPIALPSAIQANEDPLQVLVRCNNLVDPSETSDVYIVCGGRP